MSTRRYNIIVLALLIILLFTACSLFQPAQTLPEQPDSTQPTPVPSLTQPPASPQSPPASPSPVPVAPADKWSLWTNGTQLRGANIWQRIVVPKVDGPDFLGSGYIGPPYTQDDFNRLAALGANYVNLSHPGLFTERPPYVLDEQAQSNLDGLIEMAAKADLFVVITFRTGPGRSDFTFYRDGAGDWFDQDLLIESVWSDRQAQDAWVEMWRYTAQRYRDNPVVVGYDLMCEPNSNDVALGLYDPEEFYPKYSGSLYDWNQFYPRIVAGIREVDAETPILVSAMGWGAVYWLPALKPVNDPRVVYMVHQYQPQAQYTHQEPPAINTYPGTFDLDGDGSPDSFDRAWLDGYLSTIDDFKQEHGAPVSVNEFGVMRWVPNADDFMRDQMELFEQRGMNHALWVWDPAWQPWVGQANDFTFRFGPDPRNATQVDNDLQNVIQDFWWRNQARPSTFYTASVSPVTNRLADVRSWFYFIGDVPEDSVVDQIAASAYDLVVLDNIPSVAGEENYPMREVIDRLHAAGKLVVAYIDIGQAESYRVYWQNDWRIGNPAWILGEDPDGWAENYPVAFWAEDWWNLWLSEEGLLVSLLARGFDGVYLDWVEAYSDENVAAAARREGVDPVQAMIRFVRAISQFVKSRCAGCVVIAQNAAELVEYEDYVAAIDGLAQEQVWFDGGAENNPEGDCPLPRTRADVDTTAYYHSLSPACRRQYDKFPESTLHVSSEEYLYFLNIAQQKGLPVFTVDYALQPENIAWVCQTSKSLGFVPFVSNRGLDRYTQACP